MEFRYRKIDKIPCLAWIAVLRANSDIIDVVHGSLVDCFDRFFVAGAWDGDFLSGDFCRSNFPCCTGGSLDFESGYFVFCAPENMQEMIFSIKKDSKFFISNSLPFILEVTNESFDENYYNYEFDFGSGLLGKTKSVKSTLLKSKRKLYIHRCCNVIVNSNFEITEEYRDDGKRFCSYNDYYDYLLTTISRIKNNSIDNHRRFRYGLISSVSQGYDATATSVLAKKIGCNEAFTFSNPSDDNGEIIARELGYQTIHSVDPYLYKKKDSKIFEDSAASGGLGDFVSWGVYEDIFKGKLFFMGHRGDSLWERLHENVNDDLDFSAGNGIVEASIIPSEYVLRQNIIIISIPWIGASHWIDLAKISNSEEMSLYSIRDEYDRPIPRKIAEDAGIDRMAFGRLKKGAGVSFHFNTWNSLKKKMPSHVFYSLLEFKKTLKTNWWKKIRYLFVFYVLESPFYCKAFLRKTIGRFLKIERRVPSYRSSPKSTMFLLWGIHETKKRYKSYFEL